MGTQSLVSISCPWSMTGLPVWHLFDGGFLHLDAPCRLHTSSAIIPSTLLAPGGRGDPGLQGQTGGWVGGKVALARHPSQP